MFSKALLVLAVCFQTLRTGNSEKDYYVEELPEGFPIGKSVNLNIKAEYARPDCKIWLQETESGDSGNRLLISFVGTSKRFLINSYVNGNWGQEYNDYDVEILPPIVADVMAEKNSFIITFKGKQYFRDYEFPSKNIKYMRVDCPKEGKVDVKSKWSKQCGCK